MYYNDEGYSKMGLHALKKLPFFLGLELWNSKVTGHYIDHVSNKLW
jgi:hypothetical protein